MKKLISLLLILTMFLALAPAALAAEGGETDSPSPDMETDGDWVYSIEGGKAVLTGYTGSATELVIPSKLGGRTVTAIGDWAFSWRENLTSVTIPNSVKQIGIEAFISCVGLKSVKLGKGVTTIKQGAFLDCRALKEITLPASVTEIEKWAFSMCFSMTKITVAAGNSVYSDIDGVLCNKAGTLLLVCPTGRSGDYRTPAGVTEIADYAFSQCYFLTSVTFSDSVKHIGQCAFEACDGLKQFTIPAGVTQIGAGAFACRWLTDITVSANNSAFCDIGGVLFSKDKTLLHTYPAGRSVAYSIPDGVTTVGDYAFYDCQELSGVTIPDSVTHIGKSAFYNCWGYSRRGLTSLTIPDSVKTIDEKAFLACGGIKSLKLGKGLTSIGESAFMLCESLPSVTIPDSVKTIGESAFSDCTDLKDLTLGKGLKSIGEAAFYQCSSLTEVTIPNSVTKIERDILSFCTSLKRVMIGGSVTEIGVAAFEHCESLTEITFGNKVKSIGYDAFYSCDNLKDVWYGGTKKQWNAIEIDVLNDPLLSARIHYLYPPELVSATEVSGGIEFQWKAATGAVKYRVYRKMSGGSWKKIAETDEISYTDRSVKAGSTYTYTARAIDAKGNVSGYDKTGLTVKYIGSALGVPELGSVTMKSSGVQFKWKAADGAVKYRVYRKTGSGSWKYIGATSKTSYTDKKVTSGTTYTYTVRAVDADGKLSKYDKTGLTLTYISVPELVSAKKVTSGVKFTWKAAAGAEKYRVYRKTDGGSWKYLAQTARTSYTDKKVSDGKTYAYTVRGKDAYGNLSAYDTMGLSIEVG